MAGFLQSQIKALSGAVVREEIPPALRRGGSARKPKKAAKRPAAKRKAAARKPAAKKTRAKTGGAKKTGGRKKAAKR